MDNSLHPFSVSIDDAELAALAARLANTRLPDPETVDDWSQGIPLADVRDLLDYWRDHYDWRRAERDLNRWPNLITEVDGVRIHLLHVRSPHSRAAPLLLTHGWPGSILEFRHVIAALTDPVKHGGAPEDAFHVVIPALPGYGFSGKPTVPGVGIEKIADMWVTLMARLGYGRFSAHGGDWGGMVTQAIALRAPGSVLAIHTTLPVVAPDPDNPATLSDADRARIEAFNFYQTWDSGYAKQQSTRPQTLGYALADSPVGQMAWIVEKYAQWMDCGRGGLRHPTEVISRDDLLDTVMMYWLTNSATSSARLYWESFNSPDLAPIDVPAGVSQFPSEIMRPLRPWVAKRFRQLHYYRDDFERGGHFAALEVPDVLVGELRAWKRAMVEHGVAM